MSCAMLPAKALRTANPVLHQQGTFAPTNDFRWMGSAAMDKTGGIAIGYNISSATIVPSIRYAYRGPADPRERWATKHRFW